MPDTPEDIPGHLHLLDIGRRVLEYKQGSEALDDLLLYGLDDLDNWPIPQDLIDHEMEVLLDIHQKYLYAGSSEALRHTVKVHRVTRNEAIHLVELSRNLQIQAVELDQMKDRKEAVLRLQGVIKRSQEVMDIRGELQAIKQLTGVQGIDRVQQESGIKEFMDLVVSASSASPEKITPADVWSAGELDTPTTIETTIEVHTHDHSDETRIQDD